MATKSKAAEQAEQRVHKAITITRGILMDVLDDLGAMLQMPLEGTEPEEVENQVTMILEYLDKTEPEKKAGDLGVDRIAEGVV